MLSYKRAVKNMGKEEAVKFLDKFNRDLQEYKAKHKPLKAKITSDEVDKIKNMIIPMIPQLRAKISQEYALKQARGK